MKIKVPFKKIHISQKTRDYCKTVEVYFSEILKTLPGVLEVNLLGSVSRETYLKEPKDFDFFLFYESLDWLTIETFTVLVEDLFKKFTDKKVLSLTHMESKNRGFPYVKVLLEFKQKRIDLDIIPTLKDPLEYGCVDRTKKHDLYLNARLDEAKKIEIRKLKYLLKRNNLYGADSHIKGFSGYACEVLIDKYGQISKIPDDFTTLKDPVDARRNLLACVSEENLRRFFFLKTVGFKNPNKYNKDLVENIYVWPNATLKVWTYLKKHKNVISAIYVSNTVYMELAPFFVKFKKYLNNNVVFHESKKDQAVYFSSYKQILKKYSYGDLLVKHPEIQKVDRTDTKKLKTYYFFK